MRRSVHLIPLTLKHNSIIILGKSLISLRSTLLPRQMRFTQWSKKQWTSDSLQPPLRRPWLRTQPLTPFPLSLIRLRHSRCLLSLLPFRWTDHLSVSRIVISRCIRFSGADPNLHFVALQLESIKTQCQCYDQDMMNRYMHETVMIYMYVRVVK